MSTAYKTMKDFWLDVKNLQHKREVPQLGEQKICVAGVEMAAEDHKGKIKNLMIAASSLGNASVYFENNSPSGIGGFTGGAAQGAVQEKAKLMMQEASLVAGQLQQVDALPVQQDPEHVTLFTVSADGQIRAQDLYGTEARNPEHPFYAFFAYSQQLLGAFREEQEAAQADKPSKPGASHTSENEI